MRLLVRLPEVSLTIQKLRSQIRKENFRRFCSQSTEEFKHLFESVQWKYYGMYI